MFTINDTSISVRWTKYPEVIVTGPLSSYMVECYEYDRIGGVPRIVEGYSIRNSEAFIYPVEFYGNFMIKVYGFDPQSGLILLHTEEFNQRGKHLLFNLYTDDSNEIKEWLPIINEYCKYWNTRGTVRSLNSFYIDTMKYDRLNENVFGNIIGHDEAGEVYNFYKSYNIGRFGKQSGNDYKLGKWNDKKKKGNIWFGNWRVFWSYRNPRDWDTLNSIEVIEDILGISESKGIPYYSE
jgi:hypothetical protein